MHGFILAELERFVTTALGASAWTSVLREAGLADRAYVAVSVYPDHELRDVVVAASRRTGVAVDRVLFDFGRFLAPDLVRNYRHLLDPGWRTLDVLEHAEAVVARVAQGGEESRKSFAVQRAERTATIVYRSDLALCAMARGVVVGLADHYGENVSVREPVCALKGARECTIQVRESRSTEQHLPTL